jgi:hypothetical protein
VLILALYSSQAANYTSNARQGSGYWDSGLDGSTGIWNPGTHTASGALAVDPAATYEVIIPGARLRTTSPAGPPNASVSPDTTNWLVFPGASTNTLTIDGDGKYRNGAAATDPIAEIRFKYPAVYFPKVIMNGGIWDQGDTVSTTGMVAVHGEVNVNGVNFPVYNDGGADRGFLIDYLTGSGSIENHSYTDVATFKAGDRNSFALIGTSNTYSGTWNVVIGMLNGYGSNSLGTNTIVVAPAGGLVTSYDVSNTNSDLILSGRLFLHQNDTFRSVIVAGTNALSPGTYTAAQLNALYPANFPAAWLVTTNIPPGYAPDPVTNISGSITVLQTPCMFYTEQPTPATALLGAGPVPEQVSFATSIVGSPPITNQWQYAPSSVGPFTNISDGPVFSGTKSNVLTIASPPTNYTGFYQVVSSSSCGSLVSLTAQLTVLKQGGASNWTTLLNEGLGSDWSTVNTWVENTNGADYLSAVYPGSSFFVLGGAVTRTPNAAISATFPIYASKLEIDGDGTFANPTSPTIGTLQFKNASNGRVTFNKLVMNGGQMNNGQDDSSVYISGEVDILTNTPIFEDNASGTGDRGYRFDAQLTGAGTMEVHLHPVGPGIVQPLNLTCPSNTFSGQWNIINGTVLGTATNSLGTNNVTIQDNVSGAGALETLYDIYNPNGNLTISNTGQMYLHQNDTFGSMTIAGTNLANGVYTFDYLTNTFPANFPANWQMQVGSTVTNISGSITVGVVAPVSLSIQKSGANLQISWNPAVGTLLEAPSLTGPWTTNGASSPYVVGPTNAMKFYRVLVQ